MSEMIERYILKKTKTKYEYKEDPEDRYENNILRNVKDTA